LVRKAVVFSEYGEPLAWKKQGDLRSRNSYLLCRCGQSSNKPFCDDTHTTAGFDGTEVSDTGPIAARQKVFQGDKIVMKDDRSVCSSAGFCGNRLTKVWQMLPHSSDTQVRFALIAMIERCPSGALTYALEVGGEDVEPDLPTQIAVVEDGPLWVSGRIQIERSDGQTLEARTQVTLCRCGASGNKPLCDGSHSRVGFRD
jgi:CDGSH-type Zn-finger protein